MQEVKLNEIRKQSNAMRESLRELRTNIRFCGDDIKTILFTSVMPNEGKSTVVMDFARSLVEADNRVLVIDADMRKSVLVGRHRAKTSDGGSILGLSHFLSGQKSLEEVVYQTQFANLMMIFAGPSVINPTELLEGKYYSDLIESMKGVFDYVLIDCAPLGAAIDAVSQGEVSSRAVVSVKRQLEASGVRILGAVLNKVDKKKTGYYGKYYGNYYGNYYGRQGKVMQKRSVPQKASMKQNLEDIKRASMAIEKDNREDEEGQQNEKQHSKEAAKEED